MQGVGVLMDLDIRSIVHNILLEQTQQNDSTGEKTMTTYYSAWYRCVNFPIDLFLLFRREVLLRKVTEGVVYSNNQESFVNWDNNFGTKWTAEEYTNTQGRKNFRPLFHVQNYALWPNFWVRMEFATSLNHFLFKSDIKYRSS